MNITKNSDCSKIFIEDELFSDFENETNDVTAITIRYTYNNGEEVSVDLEITDIVDSILEIDAAFVNQIGDVLCDGVYCFRVTITQGTDLIYMYGNILIDCALICKLAIAVFNSPTKMLHEKYEAIKYYQQCNNCDCTTVYKLYNDLLIDLNLNSQGISDCGCGC